MKGLIVDQHKVQIIWKKVKGMCMSFHEDDASQKLIVLLSENYFTRHTEILFETS